MRRDNDREASARVLDAIAEATGVSPLEFDRTLSEVVDPDALNALCRRGGRDLTVEFAYLGYRVVVRGDGKVTVNERDG